MEQKRLETCPLVNVMLFHEGKEQFYQRLLNVLSSVEAILATCFRQKGNKITIVETVTVRRNHSWLLSLLLLDLQMSLGNQQFLPLNK